MWSDRSNLHRSLAALLAILVPGVVTAASTAQLPAGTTVYCELDQVVTSKKKDTTVGDIVRARVWRDVVVDGRTLVKAGAPVVARVSMVKPAKIAGRKGDVHIDAISTRSVDGNEVLLDGGYDKSGKGKKALAWSLFALVAWPLVFIKGKQAVLNPGTVFDASVQADARVSLVGEAPFKLRVDTGAPELEVEVLYDEMNPEEKQAVLPLRLRRCSEGPLDSASIVEVNEKPVPPLSVTLGAVDTKEGCRESRGTVDLKQLAKHFTKGINRFTVESGSARTEVILEIEI